MSRASASFDDGVVHGQIVIDASPETVFAVYGRVEHWPDWDPDLKAAGIDGPFRLGQTGWIKPLGGPRLRTRITELIETVRFVATAPLPGCRMRFTHDIEPIGDNDANAVRIVHEVAFEGPLGGFFAKRVGPKILATLPAALAGLKAHVESNAVAETSLVPDTACEPASTADASSVLSSNPAADATATSAARSIDQRTRSAPASPLPLRDRLHPVHDGTRFQYPNGSILASGRDVLRWAVTRRPATWPRWIENPPADPVVERVRDSRLRVTFINHATVLIQVDGLNILTDPVFARRVSPVRFAGPARHRAPGLTIDALPPIDAVLLSHGHYDHLDLVAMTELQVRFQPRVLAPLGFGSLLESRSDVVPIETSWWQTVHLTSGTRVTAVPARHWTSRSATDANRCLWCGYALETPAGVIYFAGDTGYGDGRHFREARDVFGPPRLALLPIGAYEPRWFMKPQHMDPDEAVRAFEDLQAAHALAIHFGTFQLTDEPHDAPVDRLEQSLANHAATRERFRVLINGRAWDVPKR